MRVPLWPLLCRAGRRVRPELQTPGTGPAFLVFPGDAALSEEANIFKGLLAVDACEQALRPR